VEREQLTRSRMSALWLAPLTRSIDEDEPSELPRVGPRQQYQRATYQPHVFEMLTTSMLQRRMS